MPAAKGGDSKQALVVTLVFFILLSIILGIVTYMGYDGWNASDKEKAKEAAAAKSAKDDAETQRAIALLYRSYLGQPVQDQKELPVVYERASKSKDNDGNVAVLAKLEQELGWDKAKGLPTNDKTRQVAALEKQKKDAFEQLAQTKEELDKRMGELKKARDARDAFEADCKKKLEELNAQRNEDLKKFNNDILGTRNEYVDKSKIEVQLKEEIDRLNTEHAKQLKSLNKEIKDLQTQVSKLEGKKPLYTAGSDQPKGKIVLMDRTGKLPYINLGSADRARPQLTFSIHALGADGRPKPESKGSLEIVHVVSEHLSQCRITAQRDEVREPVASGDVLLNPAWDPNQKRHVAIAGIVDLTGDVRRDRPTEAQRAIEEFMRSLENQHMVVDAWLDVVDNSVKGKGISRNTDFLILGYLPEIRAGAVKEDDPKEKQRGDVTKLATKMQDEATKLGVPIIRLRDFLAMTGYRMPRTTEEDNLGKVHSSIPAAGSPVEKKVSKPSSDDEGKDQDKNKDQDK